MEKSYQKVISDRIKNLCNELIDRSDDIAKNILFCSEFRITMNFETANDSHDNIDIYMNVYPKTFINPVSGERISYGNKG